MTTSDRKPFPVVLTLFTLLALAVLIGLGTWQLQRRAWKAELLASIEASRTAPPIPAAVALAEHAAGRSQSFRSVWIDCPGLGAKPFVELQALREGRSGSRLISACALEGAPYGHVLVDRGFVDETVSARPPVDPASTARARITGVLREAGPKSFVTPEPDLTARRWYARDPASMGAALDAPEPAPLFLMAEDSSNPEWSALVPAPLPDEIANRHLEYALTWFGLAAALLGVYAAVLFQRRRA